MSENPRFQVNSLKVRGEPREYWIEDWSGGTAKKVRGGHSHDKRAVERECERMNLQLQPKDT